MRRRYGRQPDRRRQPRRGAEGGGLRPLVRGCIERPGMWGPIGGCALRQEAKWTASTSRPGRGSRPMHTEVPGVREPEIYWHETLRGGHVAPWDRGGFVRLLTKSTMHTEVLAL